MSLAQQLYEYFEVIIAEEISEEGSKRREALRAYGAAKRKELDFYKRTGCCPMRKANLNDFLKDEDDEKDQKSTDEDAAVGAVGGTSAALGAVPIDGVGVVSSVGKKRVKATRRLPKKRVKELTESESLLGKFSEINAFDAKRQCPVDQKWQVSFKKFISVDDKTEADKMVVEAPSKSAAESIVRRMAKVASITSVKKHDEPEEPETGNTNQIFGLDW